MLKVSDLVCQKGNHKIENASASFFANQSGGNGGGTPSIAVNQQKIDFGDVKFNVKKPLPSKSPTLNPPYL